MRLKVFLLLLLFGGAVAGSLVAAAVAPTVGLYHVAQFATNLLYITVGSIIVLRSRQQLIGWLLAIIGFVFTFGVLLISLQERAAVDPAFITEATLKRLESPSSLSVSLLFMLILVFPTGRLVSRGWRWVVAAVVAVGLILGGVDWIEAGSDREIVADYTWVLAMAGLFAIVASSLVVRYRRGTGVERRQIGWLGYGAFLAISMYVIAAIVEASDPTFLVIDAFASAISPLAILIAITRYRLYDIDRIVNRTLVYGTVVALLAAVYAGAVVLLRGLLPDGSDLAVAASTLAVAALFYPLRKRVQIWVDRRFYRSRYDAQRTIDEFSVSVGSEVDMGRLTAMWLETVNQAVKPTSATVWIRSEARTVGQGKAV